MLFIATRLRREGRVLSKSQTDRSWRRGVLDVEEGFDKEVRRVVRVARFLAPEHATLEDVFPPLRDAQLIAVRRGGYWTLAGYERVYANTGAPNEPVSYLQSWYLEPVDPTKRDQRQIE